MVDMIWLYSDWWLSLVISNRIENWLWNGCEFRLLNRCIMNWVNMVNEYIENGMDLELARTKKCVDIWFQ